MAHQKHAKMVKPEGGKFHRTEIAILGAPCGIIQKLSREIAQKLDKFRVGYVDAAHGNDTPKDVYFRKYTDKIDFHQVDFSSDYLEYEHRINFQDCSFCLINGNHFSAEKQIVIINEKKKESLERKLDRLTDVKMIIMDKGMDSIHDYLNERIENLDSIPLFKIEEIDAISEEINKIVIEDKPKIKGLVLTGGKSTRMGRDKSVIEYHGKPQKYHIAELLSTFCEETYLSVRPGQDENGNFEVIEDTFTDLGPYGGILSAFRSDPNSAWLVVATDIPLLNKDSLGQLIENRDVNKVATCFHNPETDFPEPLITLWEPRAYPRFLNFLTLGYSCPRKALINSDINEIHLENPEVLFNANTPEEMKDALEKIQ